VEVLKAVSLYGEVEGVPVLVLLGKVFEPNVDGLLDVSDYSGEEMGSDICWAVQNENGIVPLIPEFDPDAEMPDMDAETRIQNVLIALATLENAPGKPAIIFKKAMYHMPEGYLEKTEWVGESAPAGQLVWLQDEKTIPVISGFQTRSIAATVGSPQTLTEEQVAMVLKRLSEKEAEDTSYVYVAGGTVFRLDDEGGLINERHPEAEPVVWPLAHGVRPAQQSLGINGCTDCHSESSAFFFSTIQGSAPLLSDKFEKRSAHSFMKLSKPYQKLFGLSFRVRPLLKGVLFVAAVIVGSMVFLMLMLILGRATGLIEKRR
jgi:hypothetical protein